MKMLYRIPIILALIALVIYFFTKYSTGNLTVVSTTDVFRVEIYRVDGLRGQKEYEVRRLTPIDNKVEFSNIRKGFWRIYFHLQNRSKIEKATLYVDGDHTLYTLTANNR